MQHNKESTMEKKLGQIGFEAYGDKAGAHGPWKTFDGRPMPKWGELSGDAGVLTQERWDEAARAIVAEHERRMEAERGWKWDAFAHRYVQVGATGSAVKWNRTTGA
jgi:hypothetical protein